MHRCLFVLILSAFCFSCGDQERRGSLDKLPKSLKAAYQLYHKGKFADSGDAFSGYLQTQEAKKSPNEEQQARLGVIACQLLTDKADWQKHFSDWSPGARYYWEGKTFTIAEGLSSVHHKYFADKIAVESPIYSKFLLLSFILSEDHYQSIAPVIESIENTGQNKQLAWELCLAKAWGHLSQSRYHKAKKLFQYLAAEKKLASTFRQEASVGQVLATVVSDQDASGQKLTDVPQNWKYRMVLREIDFFRSSSPLSLLSEEALNKKPIGSLLLADMMFVIGGLSKDRMHVWQQGQKLVRNLKLSGDSKKIVDALDKRFQAAMAWSNFTTGKFQQAKQIFQQLASDKGKPWAFEARLGLAIMQWKDELSLEDLQQDFAGETWPQYWLAGRKFTFYRVPARNEKQGDFDKLCKNDDSPHRSYLLAFDALCLLGENTEAHNLLGRVVEQYQETEQLYLAEKENIPPNDYAENQIWEQLD